jgi:hypothetical protein
LRNGSLHVDVPSERYDVSRDQLAGERCIAVTTAGGYRAEAW